MRAEAAEHEVVHDRDEASRRIFVMCLAIVKLALVGSASVVALALSGCAGKEVLDLGGDAGGDGARISSGGVDAAFVDAVFVVGNTVPCGDGICSPPDVCCNLLSSASPTLPGCGFLACEAENLCQHVAIACTPTTCPTGSVCCSFLELAPTQRCGTEATSGSWLRCVQGSACPDGTQQVCVQAPFGGQAQDVGCPPDEACYATEGIATCQLLMSDGGGE
jgi:hypothetical protein